MEQPLPQCLSTNSVPRAFFPRVAIGSRLTLKIDLNLSPFWAGGGLSVATWYDTAWIGGTASGEYLYRSVTALHLHYNYTAQWTTDVVWDFSLITRPVSDLQNMVLVVVLVWQALFLVLSLLCWSWSGLSETILLTSFSWLRFFAVIRPDC